MIKSFSDQLTEKLFLGETLTKKERKFIGFLNLQKTFDRLALIDIADEKQLLLTPAAHYHALRGAKRFSIDADARNSKWRITFAWENDEKTDVQLVKLEDTH